MTILHMETDTVRTLANQLKQAAETLRIQTQALNSSTQSLGWLGPSREEFVAETEGLTRQLDAQAEVGVVLAGKVETEVAEWEQVAASLGSVVGSLGGQVRQDNLYIRPENVNSTNQKRVDDLKSLLDQIESGKHVSQWLRDSNIKVQFQDVPNGNTVAYWDGSQIVINSKYANLNDYELAAILMHEGTHALDSHPLDVPIVGPVFNAWYGVQEKFMYAAYPFPEEYRAFSAQAMFWAEIKAKNNLPNSSILDGVVNLIYSTDGTPRSIDSVYKDLHNSYNYNGAINP